MAQNIPIQTDANGLSRLVLIKSGRRWAFSWGRGDEAALLHHVDALSRAPWSGLDRADAAVIRHQLERFQSSDTVIGLH